MSVEVKNILSKDPFLGKIIPKIDWPNHSFSGDVYYDLLKSIASQQLSVKVADTIFGRFLLLFPEGYPSPELVLKLELSDLRSVGFSKQKSIYLQAIASYFIENKPSSESWNSLSDEEIINKLTVIKGVGRWTTEMVLMFTLGRQDVWPIDDLGIQKGMKKIFSLSDEGKVLKQRMIELAETWRPYRSWVAFCLWRYNSLSL
jgi:DNA-3-methyladenine glycosylase II